MLYIRSSFRWILAICSCSDVGVVDHALTMTIVKIVCRHGVTDSHQEASQIGTEHTAASMKSTSGTRRTANSCLVSIQSSMPASRATRSVSVSSTARKGERTRSNVTQACVNCRQR